MANRKQLYQYKGNCCANCGLGVQEIVDKYGGFEGVFEFNHIDPHKKHPDYDNLIRRVISTEQLDEVDKCILLCSICHGVLHAQNVIRELSLRVIVGTKSAEQKFKGQLILDYSKMHARFFTDQQMLLMPYRVSLGSRRPQILFGTQLYDGKLTSFLQRIAEY